MRQDGLDSAVALPGGIPHDEVARYLQAADLFVQPTYSEGTPNALQEAMACGLPCVASAVGGIPEAIDDCVSGLLVPPRDVALLEEAMGARCWIRRSWLLGSVWLRQPRCANGSRGARMLKTTSKFTAK